MPDSSKFETETSLLKELHRLEKSHSDLDNRITNYEITLHETLAVKRLKKEKLAVKDKIRKIRNKLTPDIIA